MTAPSNITPPTRTARVEAAIKRVRAAWPTSPWLAWVIEQELRFLDGAGWCQNAERLDKIIGEINRLALPCSDAGQVAS